MCQFQSKIHSCLVTLLALLLSDFEIFQGDSWARQAGKTEWLVIETEVGAVTVQDNTII